MSTDQELYYVVQNHEDQYSIWPSFKAIPQGWDKVCGPDTKDKCLQYIAEHWTDLRPKSLKEKMAR
jgi:MbtH protein